VCSHLNPIIRGWANYYRTVVSCRVFKQMDQWMFHRQRRYVNRNHPRKSTEWRRQKEWGRVNPRRSERWGVGDKNTGQYLLKFNWFRIVRHVMVRGRASPDDPKLREYWWSRQRVNARYLSESDLELAIQQEWKCRLCGMDLLNGEELQRHHKR